MLWKYDETDDLDSATFYTLRTLFEKPKDPLHEGSVLSLGPQRDFNAGSEAGVARIFLSENKSIRECDKHVWQVGTRDTRVVIDIRGVAFSPLIQCDEKLLFGGQVIDKLPVGRFDNLHLCHVEINDDQRLEPRDENIHAVTGCEQPNLKRMEVIPEERNRCWSCGYGPLICSFCNEAVDLKCPKCREQCIYFGIPKDVPHADDIIWEQPAPPEGPVVDCRRWSGEDVFRCGGDCVVSKRLVLFLKEIKAFPFLANPVRAYVKKCTDKQKKLLTSASGTSP